MPVIIPDETVRATRLSADDLRLEIAVMLFSEGRLTLGHAAELAAMSQLGFQRVLGNRRIPLHYEVEDLERDVATLKSKGML